MFDPNKKKKQDTQVSEEINYFEPEIFDEYDSDEINESWNNEWDSLVEDLTEMGF